MIPPRLDALFAALSGPAAQERSDRPTGTSGADAWARSLAMVEAAAQPAGSPDRAGLGSDWRAELAELVSGTDQTLGRDGQSANDVVLEFRTLFDSLEGRASQPIPSTTSQPHYDGPYWPSSGELMLLYQGIDPWGGSPGAEQQQWLEQTGPYLGLPPMTDAYQGSVAVGRDFNLIDLAQAAGADPQQAFVDAWLGRTVPAAARNAYELRWQGADPTELAATGPDPVGLSPTRNGYDPLTASQPHYDGLYWPSSGELMLLYQGIDPWGGSPGAEQQQWLEQTGPYLGLPPMTDAYQGSVAVGRDFNLIDLAQAAGADPQQAFVDAWLGRTVPAAARNAYEVRWQGADRSGLAAAATGNDQTPPPLTVTRADEPTQTEAARRLALLAALMGMAGEGEAGSDLENTEPRVREFLTQLARLPEPAIARTEATSLPANAQITLQQLRQLLNDARRVVSETPPARADAQPRLSPAGLEPVAREQTGLNRLAEMQALFRAGDSAARIAPEMTRAVAFSQQLAVDQRTDPRSGSPARIDAQTAPLAALAAAAREPALPPAVQLPGQAGAGAGEMRAAAEQAMQRVVWMAARDQGVSQARLQLHPAHLGKIDIHLEVQGREASVVLNVSNAPVRETVEAMLPRLREQLEQQGINLGDASVFDSEPGDAGTEQQRSAFAAAGSETGGSEGDQLAVETELRSGGLGLLDAYA